MMRPTCFSCHEELHYISNRRMMCYNKTCEKIYAMDYECLPCSAKKQLPVLMEVVAPGEICCLLCGKKEEVPGLNLETMMRSGTISRLGAENREKQGKRPLLRSIPPGAFRTSRRDASPAETFRVSQHPCSTSRDSKLSTFPERADPYIEETSQGVTVIVEFPGHDLDQIKLRKDGMTLIVESVIATCPYRDEFVLPDWAQKPTEVTLSNGFLTIKFTKQNTK